MGFVGNKYGPKKSDILLKLGNEFFGLSDEEFKQEIEDNINEEWNKNNPDLIIDPVWLDENNEPYLKFYSNKIRIEKLYLYELGYALKGRILVWGEDRRTKWVYI